ncbi:hypothetical protein H0H93_005048 [Arthromyces matolae]|nr:hypothetical protein H0H93_005048 [Arthromyces matolae]
MKVFSLFSSLVVFSFLWSIERVHAHSNPARPLKQFTHPSTLALEIIPRSNHQSSKRSSPPSNNLRHDDTFRLTISVYDETYYLHLRPNEHLIHPAARINYYELSLDGHSYVSHSKPLLRGSFKAFWGEVIHVGYTEKRMREDAAGAIPRSHSGELGWARIVVHHQGDTARGIPPEYEGAFSVNGIVHHIMTKDNYLRTKTDLDPDLTSDDELDSSLVVWRESDVMTLHEESVAKSKRALLNSVPPAGESSIIIPICAHDRLMYNTDPQQNPILLIKNPGSDPWLTGRLGSDQQNISVFPRDDVGSSTGSGSMGTNFASSIGSSDGCPKTQKVLYMGVAADCNYVTIYGTQENATRQILTDWNSASNLYKSTFNVSLGIVELSVQSPSCPSTADPNFPWNVPCSNAELDSRLSLFSQWRGSKGDDGSGLWHLMSGCPTGSEVGIAWLATLWVQVMYYIHHAYAYYVLNRCQQSSTGSSPAVVSGTAVSTAGRTEWQVVAHEIGHNFGAIIHRGKQSPYKCVAMALSRRAKTAILDKALTQRAVMRPLASSKIMPFVTPKVALAVRHNAPLHQQRRFAAPPATRSATLQRRVRTPLLRTVRVVVQATSNVQAASALLSLAMEEHVVAAHVRLAWYTQNLQVAIPVTVIAGLVILLFLWFTARGCHEFAYQSHAAVDIAEAPQQILCQTDHPIYGSRVMIETEIL